MPLPYQTLALTLGTHAWREWRRGGIGSSDAPALMGENPSKTARALRYEKLGPDHYRGKSAGQVKGAALEPEARAHYIREIGLTVEPACLQSLEHGWLRASVDGLSTDGTRVVEIKCGEGVYRKTARTRRPPRHTYGQLQHILAVTGLPAIDFWCYVPGATPLLLPVKRDESYIARLLTAEESFWRSL